MVRFITAEKLIAKLQKHDPKLPIVLRASKGDNPQSFRQLRYMDGQDPFGHLSDLYIYEGEFANNMGQQGLCLVLDCIE